MRSFIVSIGMLAPLRRTLVYFVEYFWGKNDTVITSVAKETSPDTLNDYVRDPKIATSNIEHTIEDNEKPSYNLRERKHINYLEGSDESE